MDATGIAVLVQGQELRLRHVNDEVLRVLQLTGVMEDLATSAEPSS